MTALVPLSRLPSIPVGATQKLEPLTQDDYERLKAALPDYRYVLLAKVLRNTGLRETEVMARSAEFFYADGPFHFIRTRRGKRTGAPVWEDVALNPELGLEIEHYIKVNRLAPGDRVFRFSARQFQRVFRAAAESALGRAAHPHQLRALFTATLIEGGVPVGVAASLLGHSDERTTLRHYMHLSRDKRAEIARRMPV